MAPEQLARTRWGFEQLALACDTRGTPEHDVALAAALQLPDARETPRMIVFSVQVAALADDKNMTTMNNTNSKPIFRISEFHLL